MTPPPTSCRSIAARPKPDRPPRRYCIRPRRCRPKARGCARNSIASWRISARRRASSFRVRSLHSRSRMCNCTSGNDCVARDEIATLARAWRAAAGGVGFRQGLAGAVDIQRQYRRRCGQALALRVALRRPGVTGSMLPTARTASHGFLFPQCGEPRSRQGVVKGVRQRVAERTSLECLIPGRVAISLTRWICDCSVVQH